MATILQPLSQEKRAKREEDYRQAVARLRLEGLRPGAEAKAIFHSHVARRFLRDEILAEVSQKWIFARMDTAGASRAASARLTWPGFSRVLSRIGSFTSIQWQLGEIDGGNVYPFKIRKEPKRNIRVCLQDGSGDLENEHGSLAAAEHPDGKFIEVEGLRFSLEFRDGHAQGERGERRAGGRADGCGAIPTLRRQVRRMREAAERDRPRFRIKALNRD